jgi:hypothetical protein
VNFPTSNGYFPDFWTVGPYQEKLVAIQIVRKVSGFKTLSF